MRTSRVFKVSNSSDFKKKLLLWSKDYEQTIFLDSNNHQDRYGSFDALLAVGAASFLSSNSDSFNKLRQYQSESNDWLFGYFSYDLKNELEDLMSNNYDGLSYAELYFFRPKKIIVLDGGEAKFLYLNTIKNEVIEDFESIGAISLVIPPEKEENSEVKIKLRIHKDAYFDKANQFLEHIYRGNIYEANFCQEFYAVETSLNPISTYFELNKISEPPFATFLRLGTTYLISATPERYLKRMGDKVISQPIKGTAARSMTKAKDIVLKESLKNDPKERAENIMITDLVRNDLSKVAIKGSVNVEELCKVYSFKQVHQMISTIEAKVQENQDSIEIIEKTFPMGSMTGAPKIAAMQIIEELEETKRGLYSGAVGYFDPKGDFDFNVIIRSILYDSDRKYVSFSVGSAITAKSDPEKEYQECLLKAKAMREVLESN